MNSILEKFKLFNSKDKIDRFGFTSGFYRFLNLPRHRKDYVYSMKQYAESQLSQLRTREIQLKGDFTEDTTQAFFTPIDDIYGAPEGVDPVYETGRVPVSHLVALADQRLGIVFRGCNGVSNDVFRNSFDVVNTDDIDTIIKRKDLMTWVNQSTEIDRHSFRDHSVWLLDFERRTGLSHMIFHYPNDKDLTDEAPETIVPKNRPNGFETFTCYYLTPYNILESTKNRLDYDKSKWDFIGGAIYPYKIHHSRIYNLETRRVEFGLRGRAIAELCYVPLMCYLNTMYFVLRGLGRLGLFQGSITIDRDYPTEAETGKYLELWDEMQGAGCVVLGRNAKFDVVNMAGAIGEGIQTYMEVLLEDISAAWIFPKNQLLGRSEGGGLDGAGALISKEDYLASNLATLQLGITNDWMYIFKVMAGFKGLEDKTLRWNIDLHKTESQRLDDQIKRETLEQTKIMTKRTKLGFKLEKVQAQLQMEMSRVQLQMIKQDPKKLLGYTNEDEKNVDQKKDENFSKKTKTKDLEDYYTSLDFQYRKINDMIDDLDKKLHKKRDNN